MAKKKDSDEFSVEGPDARALVGMTDEEVLAAGHDVAGYRQGQDAKAKELQDETVRPNPFEATSNIGTSWQAGYDAGPDGWEEVPPPP